MLIEQPASLNRYVDPTIPLTWSKRWDTYRVILPLLVACAALMVEMSAFRLWLRDERLLDHWQLLAAIPVLLLGFLPGAIEVSLRAQHRSKRWLKLDAKRITTSQAPLAWKYLRAWRLEPVVENPALKKLTVEHAFGKKGKREWSIILQHPEQTQMLRSELEYLRQLGKPQTALTELPEPAPLKERRRVRGMVQMALAFYLFIHGAPLLVVGLTPRDKTSEHRTNSGLTAQESEKLGRLLVRHFSSAKQIRAFYVATGGALTALSIGLYVWGLRAADKKDDTSGESPDWQRTRDFAENTGNLKVSLRE